MNKYEILKKDDKLVAVELGTFGTPDELEHYSKQGYKEQDEEISAQNKNEAISEYMDTNRTKNISLEVSTSPDDSEKTNNTSDSTRYSTAKFVHKLAEIVGWVCVVLGILLVMIFAGQNPTSGHSFSLVIGSSIPGISLAIVGLLTVALSQVLRATIDTAENSFKLLDKLTK